MVNQWLVLPVIVPLLGASLCVLVRRQSGVWLLSSICVYVSLGFTIYFLATTLQQGEISQLIGGWSIPLGIEYRIDLFSVMILLLVAVLASIVISFSKLLNADKIAADRMYLFYTLFLLNFAGLNGVILTADMFNLFVFIEISSLSSYALICAGKKPKALFAAYQYLLYGTIGASFILIAIGLLYALTGTLNMGDMQLRLLSVAKDNTVMQVALVFFVLGIMLKCAMFPFHVWLPGAYAQAPTAVVSFFAGTTTKVFLYVLIRFLYGLFDTEWILLQMRMDWVWAGLAIAAMLYGTVLAIRQDNLCYLLAWSSVAQIGYMLLAVSIGTVTGVAAALIYLWCHAITKTGLFVVVGRIEYCFETTSLCALRGMARRLPWSAAAIVILGLSLIGMPLTAGFIGKWWLVLAIIERGWWILLPVILISSLLALVYVWRIVESLYDRNDRLHLVVPRPASAGWTCLLVIFICGNLYLGIASSPLQDVAVRAAQQLLIK